SGIAWVHQAQQRGTGHAVQLAMAGVPDDARVLILLGDVPLVSASTLQPLADSAAPLAVLVADLADPHGYGRVLRDGNGRVRAIVEEKDCDAAQRVVATVNTGILAADALHLRTWLKALRDDNAQREYLITDVFESAASDGVPAAAIVCADAHEAFGANDPWQ